MDGGIRMPALQRWLTLPAYLLFFLMLVFPMVDDVLYAKVALFGLVLFIVVLRAFRQGRLTLHPSIGLWTLFLSVVSLAFVVEGAVTGAPAAGILKQAQIYAVWPIIYALVIAGASSLGVLAGLEWVMVLATIATGAYGLDYFLTQLGILPSFLFFKVFDQGQRIGVSEGYLKINLYFLNSLPFLVPFVMAAVLTNVRTRESARVPPRWWWTAFGLGLAVALASGRRALMLVLPVAPLITLGLVLFKPEPDRVRATRRLVLAVGAVFVAIAVLAVFLTNTYHIDFASAIPYFRRGAMGFQRHEQFHALVHDWAESPLLGAGHGATSPGSMRSPTMPWSYELYYVALLFQTGLLGLGAYAAGVLWIYVMGVRIIRAGGLLGDLMLPILVGTSCLLIANAVDPYLPRFDGIWVIFLPLAVINCWLLTKGQRASGGMPESVSLAGGGPAAGSRSGAPDA